MRRTATTGLAVLVLTMLVTDVRAQPFPPDVTPAEFKCMDVVSRASKRFVAKRFKCIVKCYKKFWAGQVPETDCLPPYAGDTLVCVGVERGAEANLRNAILKRCDVARGGDCPECYSGGDCSATGEGASRPANLGGMIDSAVPGVFCERTGAEANEQDCQLRTAMALSKLGVRTQKCADECLEAALAGSIDFSECSDHGSPTMDACLERYREWSTGRIETACDSGAAPDGCPGEYPSGDVWTFLTTLGMAPYFGGGTFCAE